MASTHKKTGKASSQQPACQTCKAQCCSHVALNIDTPTCKRDYDNIRWYLMHERVKVGIDDEGDWLLEVATPCKHLDKNNRCSDYKERPNICRTYPGKAQDCEFESKDSPYKIVFDDHRAFERYLKRRGKEWRLNRIKS